MEGAHDDVGDINMGFLESRGMPGKCRACHSVETLLSGWMSTFLPLWMGTSAGFKA